MQPSEPTAATTESRPHRFWHPCHHCDGRGCEVCEETKGWWSVDAVEYDKLLAENALLREEIRIREQSQIPVIPRAVAAELERLRAEVVERRTHTPPEDGEAKPLLPPPKPSDAPLRRSR